MQNEDAEKVVKLLNYGASVFTNVERYSRKQDRNFPIKPFARFIDHLTYLNKPNRIKEIMTHIAEGLDTNKEKVIDNIFASLPYKTKNNEALKDLQKQMHETFRKKRQGKILEQKILNKLQELKEKMHTDNIENIPHVKI